MEWIYINGEDGHAYPRSREYYEKENLDNAGIPRDKETEKEKSNGKD